jgi:FkbM family methyltransferase
MSYNILLKRAFLVFKTKWLINALKGKIFSLTSFGINETLNQIDPTIKTIFDVGANMGQFSCAISHFYPQAFIFSFEPDPETFSKLKENTRKSDNITTYNFAFGNENGKIEFNKNSYHHSSSILNLHKENTDFPGGNITTINVDIFRLDTKAVDFTIQKPALLKLDVQGFELEVLKGGDKFISEFKYILLESSLDTLYENQPDFSQINNYLEQKGFFLYKMLDFNMGKKLNYIEADFLYKKRKVDL